MRRDRNRKELIGVYSSQDMAESARARLALQPGFVDDPSGFEIRAYELDRDHWTEGFLTVVHIEVPMKESGRTCRAQASRLANVVAVAQMSH